jgi:2-amino-4-hydroxy-6-hydroxymethyldihydropteridine diphosphokinase
VAEIFLLLGSNLGKKRENLFSAEQKIYFRAGDLLKKSSVYQSPPWGFQHDEDFLNQILQVDTPYPPDELLEILLQIELNMGRKRPAEVKEFSPRSIDIDILFYENKIINTHKLVIPHPRMHLRRFTLEPLNEIAPGLVHPVLKKTIRELLELCEDTSEVKIIH